MARLRGQEEDPGGYLADKLDQQQSGELDPGGSSPDLSAPPDVIGGDIMGPDPTDHHGGGPSGGFHQTPRERSPELPRSPLRVPPPATNSPGDIASLLTATGGQATPSMPSSPTPLTLRKPSVSEFLGGGGQGSSLLGSQGGLLGGGLGVPSSANGLDDPSALIQMLLQRIGAQ